MVSANNPENKAVKAQRKFESTISSAEAIRAIYIDFEGFIKETPSLIGISIDAKFEQVVLVQELKLAAEAKGLRAVTGYDLVNELIELAKKENRRIVAFSTHEINKCNEYYKLDLSPFYCNANTVAKKWKRKAFPEHKDRLKGLKDYLSFIHYERGLYLGERQSTQRIDSVRKMLAKKGSYESLTSTVKAKWTKLLEHNEIDVLGMKALVIKASF